MSMKGLILLGLLMKRLLTAWVLVASLVLGLMPGQLSGWASDLSGRVQLEANDPQTYGTPRVQLENIQFYYKTDADVRYLNLKNLWQSTRRGEISTEKAAELSRQAYENAKVEKSFEKWLYHGEPSPVYFTARAHLYNNASVAALNTKMKVTIRAKMGDMLVNPQLMLTDFEHLEKTAHWITLSRETQTVPALSPGEDATVQVMAFSVLEFMKKHPGQWPTLLEVDVSLPEYGQRRKVALEMIPDHFLVPILY